MKNGQWKLYKDKCPWLLSTGVCFATKDSLLKCVEYFCAPYYWTQITKGCGEESLKNKGDCTYPESCIS